MKCRHCSTELNLTLVDLGSTPPSNSYLTEQKLHVPEKWFPLRVLVCEDCWLAQTEDFTQANELFDADYAYFSGFSESWLSHSKNFVDSMVSLLNLDSKSHVIEIAANDGYLLQYVKEYGIPCTGIEPTKSTATAARAKGLTIIEEFFGELLAKKISNKNVLADLAIANNVLAHVPNINDFVAGIALILKHDGVATFEFPHLEKLIDQTQFDTIYHEHFSYLSLTAVRNIFHHNGLEIFRVEELETHGGSLRVFAQLKPTGKHHIEDTVNKILIREIKAGLNKPEYYGDFQKRIDRIKNDLLRFLLDTKSKGETVIAYGAAAKGNTLLNYAGIRQDLISFVVDRNPFKQGKYMPGSRILIVDEKKLREVKPNYLLILPWNLKTELMEQLTYVKEWNCKLVFALPNLQII